MDAYIEQARSFINSHIHIFVTETLALGDTPPYHHWDSCYFLCPWNIPKEDKDKLPKNCVAYFLLWKLKGGDETCHGGGMWGPSIHASIHDKSVCSAPYNMWYWGNVSDWHPSLKHGSVIIIHETHHAIMGMLHDILGYGISKSKEEHVYGKTVPHLDFMKDFGYGEGDDYEFTGWAYEQLTEEMLTKLSELEVWAPKGCIENIIPGEDINALAGESISFSISGENCGNRKGNIFVVVERDKKGGPEIITLKFEDIEPGAIVKTTGAYEMPNRDVDIYFSTGYWDWDTNGWVTDETQKITSILTKTVKNVTFKSIPADAKMTIRKV